MLFTEPMKKIELLVLKSDVDSVMRSLGICRLRPAHHRGTGGTGAHGGREGGRRAEGQAPVTGTVSPGR